MNMGRVDCIDCPEGNLSDERSHRLVDLVVEFAKSNDRKIKVYADPTDLLNSDKEGLIRDEESAVMCIDVLESRGSPLICPACNLYLVSHELDGLERSFGFHRAIRSKMDDLDRESEVGDLLGDADEPLSLEESMGRSLQVLVPAFTNASPSLVPSVHVSLGLGVDGYAMRWLGLDSGAQAAEQVRQLTQLCEQHGWNPMELVTCRYAKLKFGALESFVESLLDRALGRIGIAPEDFEVFERRVQTMRTLDDDFQYQEILARRFIVMQEIMSQDYSCSLEELMNLYRICGDKVQAAFHETLLSFVRRLGKRLIVCKDIDDTGRLLKESDFPPGGVVIRSQEINPGVFASRTIVYF